MTLKTSPLDQSPVATQLVDGDGIATQSLAFFFQKLVKRLAINQDNFTTIETQLNQGITQNIVVMVTSTTSKTLVFKDGLLTQII